MMSPTTALSIYWASSHSDPSSNVRKKMHDWPTLSRFRRQIGRYKRRLLVPGFSNCHWSPEFSRERGYLLSECFAGKALVFAAFQEVVWVSKIFKHQEKVIASKVWKNKTTSCKFLLKKKVKRWVDSIVYRIPNLVFVK